MHGPILRANGFHYTLEQDRYYGGQCVNEESGTRSSLAAHSAIRPLFKATALLFALLVMVQAVLAGQGWFVDVDLIRMHGYVGNVVFLLAVAQVVLAYIAGLRDVTLILAGAIFLLVFGQVGLGYAGRESAMAASLHVPNGVLLFGLTTAVCMRVFDSRDNRVATSVRQPRV